MCTAKKFWNVTNKSSDLSFNTLCMLTLEVCGLSEFPCGTFTSSGNRWVELAKAWITALFATQTSFPLFS